MWIPLVEASEELPQPKAGKAGAKKENQMDRLQVGKPGAQIRVSKVPSCRPVCTDTKLWNSPKKDEMVQACHGRLAGTAVLRGD